MLLLPSGRRGAAGHGASSLSGSLSSESCLQICVNPMMNVRSARGWIKHHVPLVASAAAFSLLSSSNSASHSICCTRPFFDCAAGLGCDEMCAKLVSTSSSSSGGGGAEDGCGDSLCFSRNAERSTSGSTTSSPSPHSFQRMSSSAATTALTCSPSESSSGSASA